MTEFWQQAIPILVMAGVVLLLAPFIGFAMWLGMSGDIAREQAAAERVAARLIFEVDAAPAAAPQLTAVRDEPATPHRVITTAAVGAA